MSTAVKTRKQSVNERIPRFDKNASSQQLTKALRASGIAIVENAIDAPSLAMLEAQLEPWFSDSLHCSGEFYGSKTRRFSALFAKASATTDLAIHSEILQACQNVLEGVGQEPNCDRIQLNLTQAIAIDPGETAQIIHRDVKMFPVEFPYEVMINVMWCIDPFTGENGATRVVPNSRHWDTDRRPTPEEIAIAEAPAGSAVIWTGATLHGGGSNQSSATRRGLVFSYSMGWLAQAEKLLLSIPLDIVKTLPPRLQGLIGYQVHRPNLGWVEGRDPVEWLNGQTGSLAQATDLLTEEAQRRVELLLATEKEGAG